MTVTDYSGPVPVQRAPTDFPVHLMRTYTIAAPVRTHWRRVSCAEYECDAYVHGWRTIVPADSEAAHYIRQDRSRRQAETRPAAGLACFTFEPGQQGFAGRDHEHWLPNGRPERFIVRGGDWRGCPQRDAREMRADDWVDHFANNMISVRQQIEKG